MGAKAGFPTFLSLLLREISRLTSMPQRSRAPFLILPFQQLWKHREMLRQVVFRDLRARYAGSLLGIFWLLLYPLLFLGGYAAVYMLVFKVRYAHGTTADYVLFIFSGLIPYLNFAECLGTGIPAVSGNASLVKNTLFPIELIPVKSVLAAQGSMLVGLAVLFLAAAALGRVSASLLLVPVLWLFHFGFTLGVIWVLSSLNVFLRDLQNVANLIILLLMMVSPIAYTPEMIPGNAMVFFKLNPLYYIIVSFQDAIMLQRFPRGNVFWVFAVMSLVMFYCGHWFILRLKNVFADNV